MISGQKIIGWKDTKIDGFSLISQIPHILVKQEVVIIVD